jgi:hypothetical protein
MKESATLKHQANLGEEVADVELAEGEELTLLKEWKSHYLAKNSDGKLLNVPKSLASR